MADRLFFVYIFCAIICVSTCPGTCDILPNIVIFFADDLGYGDLASYGHPTSSTPNLDKLSREGLQFSQFYSGSSVCSPSRAALLTGRLSPRTGIFPGVFTADCTGGLQLNETTIAEILKKKGYSTTIIGKWHLGISTEGKYLPQNQGFDFYLGIPYGQGQCPCPKSCFYPNVSCPGECNPEYPPCPLFHNSDIIEQPVDLMSLSERYVQYALDFITASNKEERPFFLYYAFQHVHSPQFAGKKYTNSTLRGPFGDSLAELDWSIGEIMDHLAEKDLDQNTLVFFTSDNGPSLMQESSGGCSGPFKCGKGTTYEGGQHVPAIAYWPGRIKPGRTAELASTLDLLPTIASLVSSDLPNVTIDGVNMDTILFDEGKSKRNTYFYIPVMPYPQYGAFAVRYKQYKAHFYTQGSSLSDQNNHDPDCRPSDPISHDPPLLFDIHVDPGERYDLSQVSAYKGVLETISQLCKEFNSKLDWAESQINKPKDPDVEPCCNKGCTPFPSCCHCQ